MTYCDRCSTEASRPGSAGSRSAPRKVTTEGGSLKNTDYVIYITTIRGRTWSYLKENDGWTQTGPTGRVHRLSAEQLLSHLLPPLAADQPGLTVRVERNEVEK